jgi:hypothetical protein
LGLATSISMMPMIGPMNNTTMIQIVAELIPNRSGIE